MNYLFDTNICIYIIKRKPSSVIEKFNNTRFEQLHISTVTLAELEYGVRKSSFPERNRSALADFLRPFKLVDFDRPATMQLWYYTK